jgi:hypothetical protein
LVERQAPADVVEGSIVGAERNHHAGIRARQRARFAFLAPAAQDVGTRVTPHTEVVGRDAFDPTEIFGIADAGGEGVAKKANADVRCGHGAGSCGWLFCWRAGWYRF